MNKMKIVLLAIASLFMVSSSLLASPLEYTNENSTALFPDTSTWILTRIGGFKAKQHTGSKVFITIDKTDKKVSGYTSCNYIRGLFSLKDTSLSFKELNFGKRVCDEATTGMENTLLEMLQKTTSWKIEENILYLYNKGELILEFKNAAGK